jgi:GR25 family glycosyltransferase involved in LPS biosynthesis
MSTQAIPIFVVSLKTAQARREGITRQMSSLGLAFTFFDAIDGRAMSEEERNAVAAPEFAPGRPAEIGCYLSHIAIYERMCTENIPLALILEDDCELNPAFADVIRTGTAFTDFDYLFVDSWSLSDEKGEKSYVDLSRAHPVGGQFHAHRIAPAPAGLHAYLITQDAARKRLQHAYPITASIDAYGHLPYPIRFFTLYAPKGAWQGEISRISTIGPAGKRPEFPWHVLWCRWAPWYRLWHRFHPSMRRARERIPALIAAGILQADGQWEPLMVTPEGGGPSARPLPGAIQ